MMQEERERRSTLQAEEARRLEEAASLERIKREQFIQEAAVVAEENRSFINKSRVPEYLQAIIDEEKHNGAYVLWWLKNPGGVESEPPFTRISLVWDVRYATTRQYVDRGYKGGEYVSGGINEGQYTTIGAGSRAGYENVKSGYLFKSIDVDGSSKEESLIVRGRQIERSPGESWKERGYIYYSSGGIIRPIETILHREQLDQPEVLRQALASTYLDTLKSDFSYWVLRSWPFDKQVPEQQIPEQKREDWWRDNKKIFAL